MPDANNQEHMPYSMRHILHECSFEVDRRKGLSMASNVTRALAYLHTRSPPVIHRDVKPGNLLIDRAWKVKLADFGLAFSERAKQGAGTPQYMAPELLNGDEFGHKVDVYALGMVLYEMLTRAVPFDGLDAPSIKVCLGLSPCFPDWLGPPL